MKHFFKILLFFLSLSLYAQSPAPFAYGIKTNTIIPFSPTLKVDVNSGLSVNSTTAGFVPPRMTTTQKLAISSPVAGTLVYDSTIGGYQLYNGSTWVAVGGSTATVPPLQEVVDEGNTILDNTILLSDSSTGNSATVTYNGIATNILSSEKTTYYSTTGIQTNLSGANVTINYPAPSGIGMINFTDVGNDTKTVAYVEDISAGTQNLQSVLENGNVAHGDITLWEDAEHLGNVANVASDIITVGPAALPDSAGITTGALFFKSSQPGNPSVSLLSNTAEHNYVVDYPDKPEGSTQIPVFASDLANYQPTDSDLTDIAALSPPNDNLLQRKAGAWTSRTPAQVKSDLAISIGDVSGAQATLVSGSNIKTVNSTSLLGSGNISVEPTVSAGTTSQYYRGDKTWQTLDATAVGAAPVSAGTFSGAFSLDKPGGNLFNDLAQSGSLTLSVGGSAIVGGCDCVKITANGSAITVPGTWINIGNDSVSTTNGNINRICVMKTASEIWYSVKVN